MAFNRKERLQISKKIGKQNKGRRLSSRTVNWRLLNLEKRKQREKQTIEAYTARNNDGNREEEGNEHVQEGLKSSMELNGSTKEGQRTWYSLSVALPGTILDNVQTAELKTYLSGELSRTFAIFCVDEVVVFDDTAKMGKKDADAFRQWTGKGKMGTPSAESVCFMARILEFQECPQYLRKALFPLQRPLQFSALLNPLNALHHLRSTELSFPFREGVVLDKKSKKGLLCDVGLEKELLLKTDEQIESFARVTLRIERQQNSKRPLGSLATAQVVRDETGTYWGYSVRIAKSLSEVLGNGGGAYDMVIGTSERGTPIGEMPISRGPPNSNCKILVVFGGLNGLEAAIDADPSIRGTTPTDYFQHYVNCLPGQGSRVIRTEEAIPIALTALKCKLDWTS